uniref:Uncharacterized protein n=2 Tax=Oryza rufipogon TaxID=4529 RepID=A0A0E0QZ94_ORYRU
MEDAAVWWYLSLSNHGHLLFKPNRGDVGVGGESAAQPETVEDAGGEGIMAGAAAAAAKGSRYKLHGKKSKVEQLIHVRLRQILNFMGGKTAYIKKFDGTVGVPILRSKRVPPSEEDSDAMESVFDQE